MSDLGNTEPQDGGADTQSSDDGSPAFSSFATSFLNTVPEEERPVVTKYLTKWDQGFNKYSERMNQRLGQYQAYGDPTELQKQVQLANWVRQNPQQVYDFLHQKLGNQQQQIQTSDDDDLDELPPKVRQALEKMGKIDGLEGQLGQLTQFLQQQTAQQQEEAGTRELNGILEQLQGSMKYYNRQGVLGLIAAGHDPQEAANLWDQQVAETLKQHAPNQPNRPRVPPTFNSAGAPPVSGGNKRPRDLSEEDAKSLSVDMLTKLMGE